MTRRRTLRKVATVQRSELIDALLSAGQKTAVRRTQSLSLPSNIVSCNNSDIASVSHQVVSVKGNGIDEHKDNSQVESNMLATSVQPLPSSNTNDFTDESPRTHDHLIQDIVFSISQDSNRNEEPDGLPVSSDSPNIDQGCDKTLIKKFSLQVNQKASSIAGSSSGRQRKASEQPKRFTQNSNVMNTTSPLRKVSQLKALFSHLDDIRENFVSSGGTVSGGNVRRTNSMPLQGGRPTIFKVRETTFYYE